MSNIYFIQALISVVLVSLISLIGIITIPIKLEKIKNILIYFVSFSAGALFGDVFIHLLPEVIEDGGFNIQISLYILFGIVFSLVMEKIIQWRHCHMPITKNHVHRLAFMNLFGDIIHNFIDGLILAGSYLTNFQVGVSTTIAIILHEIPQEIGDFGVLLHSGFTKKRAIIFNFLVSLTAVLGVIVGFYLSTLIKGSEIFLNCFAMGTFIYIAGSDLIPELHKEEKTSKGIIQIAAFILGILVMMSLLLLE